MTAERDHDDGRADVASAGKVDACVNRQVQGSRGSASASACDSLLVAPAPVLAFNIHAAFIVGAGLRPVLAWQIGTFVGYDRGGVLRRNRNRGVNLKVDIRLLSGYTSIVPVLEYRYS